MALYEGKEEYIKDFEDISENQDKGILKKIIKSSDVETVFTAGDTAVVHYVGKYFGGKQDGEQFDSSRDRGKYFEFEIKKGHVIKAWDKCVSTMKIGEVCELVASSDYCYMDGKHLRFEIELFDVKGCDVTKNKDGSVRKSVIKEGTGQLNPSVGSNVTAHVVGRRENEIFDDRTVTYDIGDFEAAQLPRGVDLALRNTTVNEVIRVTMYGENSVNEKCNMTVPVASGAKVVYEITLKHLDKIKHLQTIEKFEDQLAYAETVKDKANTFLKEGKYNVALEMYNNLSEEIQYLTSYGVEQKKKLDSVTNAILSNTALVHLKLNSPYDCISACEKILERENTNEKALFRLGQAKVALKDHEEAIRYFKSALTVNPKNSSASAQLRYCEDTVKRAKEKENAMYRSAFNKMANTGFGDQYPTKKNDPKEEEAEFDDEDASEA